MKRNPLTSFLPLSPLGTAVRGYAFFIPLLLFAGYGL